MIYKRGDLVWLRAAEREPRQRALILGSEVNGTYDVILVGDMMVLEPDPNNDGVREV